MIKVDKKNIDCKQNKKVDYQIKENNKFQSKTKIDKEKVE